MHEMQNLCQKSVVFYNIFVVLVYLYHTVTVSRRRMMSEAWHAQFMPKIWLKNCPLCNPQSVDLRDCEAREGERAQYCQTFLVFRGFTQVSCLKPLTNAQGLCFFRICLKLISSSSVAANKLLLSEKSIKPQILVRLTKIYSKFWQMNSFFTGKNTITYPYILLSDSNSY